MADESLLNNDYNDGIIPIGSVVEDDYSSDDEETPDEELEGLAKLRRKLYRKADSVVHFDRWYERLHVALIKEKAIETRRFINQYLPRGTRLPGFDQNALIGHRPWRFYHGGPLAWIEFFLRLVAVGVAMASLSVFETPDREYPAEKQAEQALVGFIAGWFTLAVVQRGLDKDVLAMIVAALSCLSAWVLFAVLFRSRDPGAFVFVWGLVQFFSEFCHLTRLCLNSDDIILIWYRPLRIIATFLRAAIFLMLVMIQTVIYTNSWYT